LIDEISDDNDSAGKGGNFYCAYSMINAGARQPYLRTKESHSSTTSRYCSLHRTYRPS